MAVNKLRLSRVDPLTRTWGRISVRSEALAILTTPFRTPPQRYNSSSTDRHPESAVTSGARGLLEQQIGGQFLGSNPYLGQLQQNIGDSVFNQTQNRFAGAGRNVGGADAQGAFRRDLTDQLAGLNADQYNRERAIQQNSIGQASQFDQLNQFINRLGLLSGASNDRTISGTQSGTNVSDVTGSTVNRGRSSPFDILGGLFG